MPTFLDDDSCSPVSQTVARRRAKTDAPPSNANDALAFEVLARVQFGVQKRRRDPRELYRCFQSRPPGDLHHDEFLEQDMRRLVTTIDPDLQPAQLERVWRAMGKEDGDVLKFDEFLVFFGPCAPPVPFSWHPLPCNMSDVEPERAQSGPGELRIQQLLFFRLGRAIIHLSSDEKHDFNTKADEFPVMSREEFVALFGAFRLALAQEEAEALFLLTCGEAETIERQCFERAACIATTEEMPTQLAWAAETLAMAGVAARSGGGTPLAVSLVGLGGADDAAEAVDLRCLLGQHLTLHEDNRWEVLLQALDKRFDGRVLLESLAQWAAGIGTGEHVQVLDMNQLLPDWCCPDESDEAGKALDESHADDHQEGHLSDGIGLRR